MTKFVLLAGLLLLPQDAGDVAKASKATIDKGSYSFTITPQTDLKDILPSSRAAVAGVPVTGEMLKDGTYHVSDGTYEIYGRGLIAFTTKTKDGWVPLKQVVDELMKEIGDEVGEDEMSRGNITQAKTAYRKLLAYAHLIARAIPPGQLLFKLETDFKNLKKDSPDTIDGKKCPSYTGELKDLAAHTLLQGPYEQLVKSGAVTISDFKGHGKIWVSPDGLIRRTVMEAAGKFTVVDKAHNSKKTTPATVQITVQITKVGETILAVPRDAEVSLKSQEIDAERK